MNKYLAIVVMLMSCGLVGDEVTVMKCNYLIKDLQDDYSNTLVINKKLKAITYNDTHYDLFFKVDSHSISAERIKDYGAATYYESISLYQDFGWLVRGITEIPNEGRNKNTLKTRPESYNFLSKCINE